MVVSARTSSNKGARLIITSKENGRNFSLQEEWRNSGSRARPRAAPWKPKARTRQHGRQGLPLDMRHASKELSLNGLQPRQLLFCTDLRDQGVVKHLELWRELGVERAIALLLEAKDVENAAEHFLFCLGQLLVQMNRYKLDGAHVRAVPKLHVSIAIRDRAVQLLKVVFAPLADRVVGREAHGRRQHDSVGLLAG